MTWINVLIKMNLQFYLEKLRASGEFQSFIRENPGAFLCSGFLTIDKEKNNNKVHFDYFIPQGGKMTSFQLESKIQKVPLEKYDDKIPEEVSTDFELNFEEIESLISKKMENENIKSKIQKIILSLQKVGGKNLLIGTVFVSSLGLLKIVIDIEDKKIKEFEKKSLFDIMNVFKKD